MRGNSFGTLFNVVTFGESHGPALGCIVDGCPAGLPLSTDDINRELTRRRSSGSGVSTGRCEKDKPEILSGIYEGKTLGTPIAVLVRNEEIKPEDYENIKDTYRPGHADWPWEAKFGFRDHRGGGRSSARETVGRLAGGAIARVFLNSMGIEIKAWTSEAAGIASPAENDSDFDWNEIENNPLRMPNRAVSNIAMEKIEEIKAEGDSAGCTITCITRNLPPGLGEPVFDKLDARIASVMLSLGSAKGIEFGAGFAASKGRGSSLNDSPAAPGLWKTNNAGGVLGGLSTGMDLRFTVAFKPVPSIMKAQETINRWGEKTELQIQGRHDACIAPRVVPVVEAMCALVLADFILLQRSARLT
jgi:chorismate synthase